MSLLIKLKQAVVVEGKYDKITLENIIDAFIIPTEGYRIFKDKQKRDLIRLVAKKNGIIVITDSDSSGGVIRSYLKQICPEGSITNVYVPQLRGKARLLTVSLLRYPLYGFLFSLWNIYFINFF